MQPWQFFEKSVGAWTIESARSQFRYPLASGESLEGPAREYFYYLRAALDALCELFTPRRLEWPPGSVLLKSYSPLAPGEMERQLRAAWTNGQLGALVGGLARAHIKEEGKVLLVEIPDALRFALEGAGDRYVITLATNCDLWLERTVSGEDNAEAGSLNAAALGHAILRLESALDGRVISYSTEIDGVRAGPAGFS